MKRLLIIITLLTFSCVDVDINKEYSEGLTYYNQKKFVRAIKNFTKVISATDSCNNCLFYRGDSYRRLSNYEKAEKDFTKLLASPESKNKCIGYINRGSVYYDELNYSDALENYKKGLQYCSDSATVMNMISHMYFATNRKDSGCIYYQRSIRIRETEWNQEIPKYCKDLQ